MADLAPGEAATFTCAACGRTFDKEISDAEAMAEAKALYPPAMLEDVAVICHDCYRGMNQ